MTRLAAAKSVAGTAMGAQRAGSVSPPPSDRETASSPNSPSAYNAVAAGRYSCEGSRWTATPRDCTLVLAIDFLISFSYAL
jgi:hypothetical protein